MMTDDWDAPLSVLGPDLHPTEWAARAGCSTLEITARARALRVRLAGERDTEIEELVAALHDAWACRHEMGGG